MSAELHEGSHLLGARQEAVSATADKKKHIFWMSVLPRFATREQFIQRLFMCCALRRGRDSELRGLFRMNNMARHPMALVDDPREWARSEAFFG